MKDSDFAAATLSYWCAIHMSAAAALHAIAADDRLPELDRMLRTALRGPAPCDDCVWAQRCAAQLLACQAFADYLTTQRAVAWQGGRRGVPTRTIYARIYALPAKRGPASGLRASTHAKFDALRATRGTFESVEAALTSVGLTLTYWGYMRERDEPLAEHVRSLVHAAADGTLPITRCGRRRATM